MNDTLKVEATVQVTMRLSARDLWQGVFGSGITYAGYPWWHHVWYPDGDSWEEPGTAFVYTINPDDPLAEPEANVIKVEDLALGLQRCIELQYQPWEGLNWADPTEYDSDAADLILQCAIWNEARYG